MTPERLRQIEQIHQAARERAAEFRAAFLDGACGPDAGLRQAVEEVLVRDPLWPQDETRTQAAAGALGRRFGSYQILSPLGAGGMRCIGRTTANWAAMSL